MIILKNTTEPQDVMLLKPYQDSGVKRSEYLKSSDLKTLNDESLVGQGNISIPVVTKTSDLINDSGFIDATGLDDYAKKTDIPTKTSQLTNDSGYLTEHQSLEEYYTKTQTDTKLNDYAKKTDIPTKTSQLDNDSGFIDESGLSDYAKKTEIPSKVSQLENDRGYIDSTALTPYALKTEVPAKTSDLTNDSDYTTKSYVDSSISTALGSIETKLSTI